MKTKLLIVFLAICTLTNAQYTKLLDFAGASNGDQPNYGSPHYDGTFLYGMTRKGGANNFGVIFKILPDGTGYVKLLDFDDTTNGKYPYGSLISDGTFLYGMTQLGGVNGMGVIFKILPDGTGYVKLLDFAGASNGAAPYGSLLYDGTFLYGMTYQGGVNGMGVIFKILPNGTGYVKLLDFAGPSNGGYPRGSLISDGTFLYGMTYQGGVNAMGVIFKIQPNGTGYAKLLDFAGASNGSYPIGSLLSDGTFLYGMTLIGGANNIGLIFKIQPNGTGYVDLMDFAGPSGENQPYSTLVSDGTFLYGMTFFGGTFGGGVIFKIQTNGTGYTKLLDFAGASNGGNPMGSLSSDGTFLYGMTSAGGINNTGVIFKYQFSTMGLYENNAAAGFSIYPNPFSTLTVLQTDVLLSNATLTVYNSFGQQVKQIRNISGQTISFSRDNLASGLYFVQLTEENKIIAVDKLVITD